MLISLHMNYSLEIIIVRFPQASMTKECIRASAYLFQFSRIELRSIWLLENKMSICMIISYGQQLIKKADIGNSMKWLTVCLATFQ